MKHFEVDDGVQDSSMGGPAAMSRVGAAGSAPLPPSPAIPGRPGPRESLLEVLRGDYVRHGRSLTEPAFISLLAYRYGRWAWQRRNPVARWVANKGYWFLKVFVINFTKIRIPPETVIGKDFHIIHSDGSMSVHCDTVIGDRCGVMHNVTIGTNMGPGAPVIGDDVFIGVNSSVLGRIRIGDRVRIGANTAVTTNVPSDSIVIGSPGRVYRRLSPLGSGVPAAEPKGSS
jgi:serine O-acetyltransferase